MSLHPLRTPCSGTLTANLHSVPILALPLPLQGPDIAGNALGHDFIMATWLAPCKKQGCFYDSRMGSHTKLRLSALAWPAAKPGNFMKQNYKEGGAYYESGGLY